MLAFPTQTNLFCRRRTEAYAARMAPRARTVLAAAAASPAPLAAAEAATAAPVKEGAGTPHSGDSSSKIAIVHLFNPNYASLPVHNLVTQTGGATCGIQLHDHHVAVSKN